VTKPLRKIFSIVAGAIALACCAVSADSEELRLFTARYQVRFYGLSGGVLELTLRRGTEPDQYVYESKADPSFLGSFMISDSASESSTMLIDDNGVRPLKFLSDDGKKGDEKDSNILFDWKKKRLTGRSERNDFDQDLPEHIQDHLSIQIAVVKALLAGREPGDFSLLDAGEVKKYRYTKDGNGTVKFKGRSFDAAIIKSERSDSPGSRVTRYWHVAEQGSLPVRAERSRNGKIDLTMELVDLKFLN